MLGGSRCCFIIFFTHNALLLLGFWGHALDAYTCKPLYGREGGTIVLSPEPTSETLTMAYWNFNSNVKVADINLNKSKHQFTDRVSLDPKSYSLTIQELKSTDSGNFTFVSAGKGQRPTSCVRLTVQEVLTQPPTLSIINNTKISNESCVVLVKCSSEHDKDVSYRWTVNNWETRGSTLQYQLKTQEGDITATCTVSNMVSEVSESESISCKSTPKQGIMGFLIIVGVACAVLVSIIVLVIFCRYKKAQTAEADEELTVYAEIEEITPSKQIMKPCSVYETLEDRPTTAVKPKAHTVYDQIQFNRVQQHHNR